VRSVSQWPDITELADKVRKGELKARQLVIKSLDTISKRSEYDAIIVTLDKLALERADAIDSAIKNGETLGPLAGVPFIAKDNFLVFGSDTTAASNILRGFEAPYQATAINRLEDAGAICVAKSNMDAFAHGASTENSDFFITKNPYDKTRVPGGSSGGSAASVVLDMVPFAIGTDTGGSVRQPASFSGCIGYKPTYGLISRNGVVAMASSTDVVGPLTRSVADTALIVDVLAGQDPLDGTTIERDDSYLLDSDYRLSNAKIGIVKEYLTNDLMPEIKTVVLSTINKLKEAGADIKELSLPSLPLSLAVYYIVVPAEISSNLSRYDGQRFGYNYKNAKNLYESYAMSRGIGFGKEAKRRIMIGTYVLSSGYYDAYYKKAQTVRTKLINEFNQAFRSVDFLVGPTYPTTAFKIGENTKDPLQMYLGDIMTVGASLVGIPAISIPDGEIYGLPIGLQLMAAQRQDKALLSISKSIEEIIR
jgi:aspartyl-tRNA(Asn)/glutamyl-tRNA(Gln) amidotransferase subunit A